MAGEGLNMRKAREEKGWSHHDVEDAIKIRVRYLEALENEQYDVLPGPTYSKGFLRTYARHLGLNSDEIINLYNLISIQKSFHLNHSLVLQLIVHLDKYFHILGVNNYQNHKL